MVAFAIPLIIQGVAMAAKAISDKKKADSAADNVLGDLTNRASFNILQKQNFDPLAGYGKLARGRLFGAIAKSWGLDDIVGKDLIEHIGNKSNIPGTSGIGGAPYSTDPSSFGSDPFTRPKTGGAMLGAIAGIAGGVGTALSGAYPNDGGDGTSGGIPGASADKYGGF